MANVTHFGLHNTYYRSSGRAITGHFLTRNSFVTRTKPRIKSASREALSPASKQKASPLSANKESRRKEANKGTETFKDYLRIYFKSKYEVNVFFDVSFIMASNPGVIEAS
ncbi:MAG TPA: hypothetical protein PLD82_01485 [Spirochaetota bacterium]|nr:hypothetical protein [Spirochaetota bacterium]HPH01546.1 hypothetical protein [Spirochaetota bacterium]